jgi:ribonuclease HII
MLCGIDEAGRGCLAGPLVVAGVILERRVYKLADSKSISEQKREELYEKIIKNARYKICFTDNHTIDKYGLSMAIRKSIIEIVDHLKPTRTIMDGNTTFSVKGIEAVIKADLKIAEVKAASILAKVSRDRYMCEIASDYSNYQFEKHKGYGTKLHIQMIEKYGMSDLHRKSFKVRSLQPSLFE